MNFLIWAVVFLPWNLFFVFLFRPLEYECLAMRIVNHSFKCQFCFRKFLIDKAVLYLSWNSHVILSNCSMQVDSWLFHLAVGDISCRQWYFGWFGCDHTITNASNHMYSTLLCESGNTLMCDHLGVIIPSLSYPIPSRHGDILSRSILILSNETLFLQLYLHKLGLSLNF